METAWIQVFILSISECVAPAGKTVCQEQQFELEFLTRSDCEVALEQFVALKEESERVIVDKDGSSCFSTARKREVWDSIESADTALSSTPDWRAPDAAEGEADFMQAAHDQRLAEIPECNDARPVYPCSQGLIIVEEPPSRQIEVWRLESEQE